MVENTQEQQEVRDNDWSITATDVCPWKSDQILLAFLV